MKEIKSSSTKRGQRRFRQYICACQPCSIVFTRASGFFFSGGTFEYGANSTTAYASLPEVTKSICVRRSTRGNVVPALSRKRCPSYSRLNVATCASCLKAMYAREAIFSFANLYGYFTQRGSMLHASPVTHRVLSFPGKYTFQVTDSSVTQGSTLCQKISSGRLGGRRRTMVLRRLVVFS